MKPQRIQRKRTKGWRMPEGTVYVGRGSMWGNPFKVLNEEGWPLIEGPDGFTEAVQSGGFEAAQKRVVELYRDKWLPDYMSPTHLRGKNLACWCDQNEPCHADVLLDLANVQ
jgi:hypothetical protein